MHIYILYLLYSEVSGWGRGRVKFGDREEGEWEWALAVRRKTHYRLQMHASKVKKMLLVMACETTAIVKKGCQVI